MKKIEICDLFRTTTCAFWNKTTHFPSYLAQCQWLHRHCLILLNWHILWFLLQARHFGQFGHVVHYHYWQIHNFGCLTWGYCCCWHFRASSYLIKLEIPRDNDQFLCVWQNFIFNLTKFTDNLTFSNLGGSTEARSFLALKTQMEFFSVRKNAVNLSRTGVYMMVFVRTAELAEGGARFKGGTKR